MATTTPYRTNPGRAAIHEQLLDILEGATEIETRSVVADVFLRLNLAAFDRGELLAFAYEGCDAIARQELAKITHNRRLTKAVTIDWTAADIQAKTIGARIFEPVGGDVRVALTAHTRPNAIAAKAERVRQVAGFMPWIRYHGEVIASMPDDTTTVGEFFSDQQYDALFRKHFQPGRPDDQIPGI